jgi:hypothetical protein
MESAAPRVKSFRSYLNKQTGYFRKSSGSVRIESGAGSEVGSLGSIEDDGGIIVENGGEVVESLELDELKSSASSIHGHTVSEVSVDLKEGNALLVVSREENADEDEVKERED